MQTLWEPFSIRAPMTSGQRSRALVFDRSTSKPGPGSESGGPDGDRGEERGWKSVLRSLLVVAMGWPLAATPAASQAGKTPHDTATAVMIDTVRVGGRIDDLTGIAATASQGRVGRLDLLSRPITREGELLETVPGVIVTQHSGEGKANQYFVRGFNLDHGTDFSVRVEGMPVNLPTHGHGQGYTDLNFIIPEFVELLDYHLGVYNAEQGDFGSAGGVELHLARTLDRPLTTLTLGRNGFARVIGGASPAVGRGTLLLGGEAHLYNGPWERKQDLRKLNGMARYTWERGDSRFSVLGLAYRGRWNPTDQIPRRAVADGSVGRYGLIDSTDAGNAERYSLSSSWRRLHGRTTQELQLFGVYSNLNLFSNFTYFLENPAQGDQFKQKDRRLLLGGVARHVQEVDALGAPHVLTTGMQHRTDVITGLGLMSTAARVQNRVIRQDRVVQTGTGVFLEAVSRWRPWLRTVVGGRADVYTFDVESDEPENSGDKTAGILSPKASVVLTSGTGAEVYLSGGFGFHSNDARGVTISIDPVTRERAKRVDPLVRSRGAEIGVRATSLPGLRSTFSAWVLQLNSELLFVGDAGGTEPSGRGTRAGVTWANFYRPFPGLSIDGDLSLARARLDDAPRGEDRIPGALERVFAGGAAWMPAKGVSAALRIRHFGEYPLIEDNSVRAGAVTLVNSEVGYRFGPRFRLEVALLNLLNTAASDIEYFYTSRLPGEPLEGVADVHFHPVEPRQMRVSISWQGAR